MGTYATVDYRDIRCPIWVASGGCHGRSFRRLCRAFAALLLASSAQEDTPAGHGRPRAAARSVEGSMGAHRDRFRCVRRKQ